MQLFLILEPVSIDISVFFFELFYHHAFQLKIRLYYSSKNSCMVMQVFLLSKLTFRSETTRRNEDGVNEEKSKRIMMRFVTEHHFEQIALVLP